MKTKLLLISFLGVTIGFSQTDIEQLHSATGSEYTVMSGTIDQSVTGANILWDFTNLTPTSTILDDTYTDAGTTATIETFEGATLQNRIDLAFNSGVASITGVLSQGIDAVYTDAALLGTFPLSFGYTNSDQVEGTYTSTSASGNIRDTSTVDISVDAWGNLQVGTFNGEVTRLKLVQNLTLDVLNVPFPATITSYFYYDANTDDLVFRYSRVQADPPLVAAIDETVLESLSVYTLSTVDKTLASSQIQLLNPVKDDLRFYFENGVRIGKIKIYDISGRVVLLETVTNNALNIGFLSSGMYIASIETNQGIVLKKFVKE